VYQITRSDQTGNCFIAVPKKLKLWRCWCCINTLIFPCVASSHCRVAIGSMDDLYAGSFFCLIQKTSKSHTFHRGKTITGFDLLAERNLAWR